MFLRLMFLVFALPLTAFMVAADISAVSNVMLQVKSESWPPVTGTITQSETVRRGSNKGTSVHLKLTYTYSVDGQSYEGHSLRFTSFSWGDPEALAKHYSLGATFPVYVRPGQPSEAVLEKGLGNSDLFLFMFLLPLHLLALWLWAMGVRSSKPKPPFLSTFVREDGRECATVGGLEPTVWALLVLGGSALAGVMLGGLFGAYNAPLETGVGAWGFVITCGVLAGRLASLRRQSGHYDLRLHPQSRSLSLPPVSGRRHRLDLRWRDVRAIRVGPPASSPEVGHLQSYPVTLEHIAPDGESRQEPVANLPSKEQADALADWLRTHIQVGETAQEERPPAQPRARPAGTRRQS
jgi:hypothetical protein